LGAIERTAGRVEGQDHGGRPTIGRCADALLDIRRHDVVDRPGRGQYVDVVIRSRLGGQRWQHRGVREREQQPGQSGQKDRSVQAGRGPARPR